MNEGRPQVDMSWPHHFRSWTKIGTNGTICLAGLEALEHMCELTSWRSWSAGCASLSGSSPALRLGCVDVLGRCCGLPAMDGCLCRLPRAGVARQHVVLSALRARRGVSGQVSGGEMELCVVMDRVWASIRIWNREIATGASLNFVRQGAPCSPSGSISILLSARRSGEKLSQRPRRDNAACSSTWHVRAIDLSGQNLHDGRTALSCVAFGHASAYHSIGEPLSLRLCVSCRGTFRSCFGAGEVRCVLCTFAHGTEEGCGKKVAMQPPLRRSEP